MNLRLLVIIFLAIAVGIGAGWFLGHTSSERQTEALLNGCMNYTRATDRTLASSAYDKSGENLKEGLERGQTLAIFNLYRYSADIDSYLNYKNLRTTSSGMANELISHVDYDSPDAYFNRFNQLYIYGEDSKFQTTGTPENKSFRSFIESAFTDQKEVME